MKTQFKRIMLVLGDNHDDLAAILSAVQLANLNKASLTVVRVINRWSEFLKLSENLLKEHVNLKKLLTEDLEKRMRHSIKSLTQPDKVKYKILEGTSFIEVIKQVIKGRHDLLITSAEGEKKIDVGMFSGTDFHLLRKCPCPVWVVKRTKRVNYKNIMVAVDLDPEDKVKRKLNDKLMRTALLFAGEYKANLHVYYAWSLPGEKTLRHSPFLKVRKSEIDKKVKEEKEKSKHKLDDFLNAYDIGKVKVIPHLQKGLPAELMPRFIKKHKVDLAVMGTVCRVGVPGFFIGNTAEEVLRKIRCSVLTIKPDGFKSPVH